MAEDSDEEQEESVRELVVHGARVHGAVVRQEGGAQDTHVLPLQRGKEEGNQIGNVLKYVIMLHYIKTGKVAMNLKCQVTYFLIQMFFFYHYRRCCCSGFYSIFLYFINLKHEGVTSWFYCICTIKGALFSENLEDIV